MIELDKPYEERLDQIRKSLQESEELQSYLDTEEEEDYRKLVQAYEPNIYTLHQEIAKENPLQLLSFEYKVLHEEFEGLFIPKILGFAVLRGVLNENYKYHRPQKHFKKIVEYICYSANFEMLKTRIGQSLQIGLGLSSGIWVTNLINQFSNKKIKQYLQSKYLAKYRSKEIRQSEYLAYKLQFRNDNYQTSFFPKSKNELKGDYPSLYEFLIYRIKKNYPADSYEHLLLEFAGNADFMGTKEHVDIFFLFTQFINRSENTDKPLKNALGKVDDMDNIPRDYYKFRLQCQEESLYFFQEQDERLFKLLDKKSKLYDFLNVAMEVHQKGYLHDDAINAVKGFYNTHPGSSIENECVRKLLLGYFREFLTNIDADEYEDYMEFSKIFPTYLEIFANEHFLLDLRELNLHYLRKLLKEYTDKRGKDYQDIKKFVMASWIDFGFFTKKKLTEFFKTRRKRKKAEA